MKNFQISKLIEILKSSSQTHISTEEILKAYSASDRSDLIADNIEKLLDQSFYYTPNTTVYMKQCSSISQYLLNHVPRIFYGRCFGHTYGLVKYIDKHLQKNSGETITIAFPNTQMSRSFFRAFSHISSSPSLLYKVNIVTNSIGLQNKTSSDILIISDFHSLVDQEGWLLYFSKHISSNKKIIIIGDFIG